MFVRVEKRLLHTQDYDACLRAACDYLYSLGVNNYIHYTEPRCVDLTDLNQKFTPEIDYPRGGINFAGCDDENYS